MPQSTFNSNIVASMIGGTIIGEGTREVTGFAKIEEAQQGELTFLANDKYISHIEHTSASIIIMSRALYQDKYARVDRDIILVDEAYIAMNTLLESYQQMMTTSSGGSKHDSAIIASSAVVSDSAEIGALCILEDGCEISDQVILKGQNYIGKNVKIGTGTYIYPGVKILDNCTVGNNVIIHANAVIGADGFGYVPNGQGGYKKTPQLGAVTIEDDVEIGANTTIDRATLGNTVIGKGVKIDNLVQIAHNASIGADTAIAAQAGISGSTKIGARSIIGGQAGIVGHIQLAAGTKINAQSGVTKSIKEENTAWTGSPAGPYQETLRSQLLTRKLSELFKKVDDLQKNNTKEK